ncbi:bifunctional hydroxymethylpyrimidine kinase/phosphomethylpyrimidine kinase [Oscillospiraceae bacterium CM]|nr:bifunctional hydroxymethylpyrimidine kinase/phosphomethylpyrimidine kinase [Oscillospiraceae bacterium CM]
MLKKVLTIAGSDCSGGAGIQADIKTITAHKMYAMSAITALTAQNTTGVFGIMDATPDFVAQQLDCIFTDIRPDAVKIGMVSNQEIIEVIARKLLVYGATNIVLDPVMVATSGTRLLSPGAEEALIRALLPLATVVTPNIPEAAVLSGLPIGSGKTGRDEMVYAASAIAEKIKGGVLVKGGHLNSCADDLLYAGNTAIWFETARVDNPNTHGTGCTLSAAIACHLAGGLTLTESVHRAKAFLTGALKAGLDIGKGRGPLDHTYGIRL